MIYVVATTQVKPESPRRLHQGREGMHRGHPQGEGCLSYESHTSINDPNLFVVVERWESCEDSQMRTARRRT